MTTDNETCFKRMISALSEAGGFEPPAPQADGRILLELDDGLGVALMPSADEEGDAEAVVVSFVIGNVNTASAEALRALLAANYMWALSENGSFAVEDASGSVVLQRAFMFPVEDVAAFVEAFGRLAGAARDYREQLASDLPPVDPDVSRLQV